ncbi:MAG: enoyl-CoA hydratase/isomerase family protein [Gammaproteobacteria bacterium]|nr:enoyl-CoA hydratase/isomerase family protein [Gammaproteobacteria bacterium]
MLERIIFEKHDQVGLITLNRGRILNAIDKQTLDELTAIINQCAKDDGIYSLVITGDGRAFSAGGDIKHMMADTRPEIFRKTANAYQVLARAMQGCEKPIIAAINGYCLGGGLELALLCDLRFAAKSAKLGLPDAELGFSPTGGLTYILPRLIGHGRALHLTMLPDPIGAVESERIGLVTQVFDDGSLLQESIKLASRIAQFPAHGLAFIKNGYLAALENDFEQTLELEEDVDVACFTHPETQKAMADFLQSRKK